MVLILILIDDDALICMEQKPVASILKSLSLMADPTRVRLLLLLREEELSVAELQEILTLPQSNISAQLARLKGGGLVKDRRSGKNRMYCLAPTDSRNSEPREQFLRLIEMAGTELPERKRDQTALKVARRKRANVAQSYFDAMAGKFGRHYIPGRSWKGLAETLIKLMPKVVIALVPGWAAGGGHSLNVVCDLSIASIEHAKFKQTDADVGSFDGGFGSAYLARQAGQKFAREIFFLGQEYDAHKAVSMGVVNLAVAHKDLEKAGVEWAAEIMTKSPTSIRMLKYAMNAVDDGIVGQQIFAGEATRLAYATEEAAEGKNAFLEKREPNWAPYPWHF
jgi:dihydroxynaphthoic acid synthetase